MAVRGPEIVGSRFSSRNNQSVTTDALAAFAKSINSDAGKIPPTFLISFSISAAEEFLPTIGFDWTRVVHGEQRFLHHQKLYPGIELQSTSEIESYKNLAGNEFVTVRTDFFEVHTGEKVTSTWSTLVFRGEV